MHEIEFNIESKVLMDFFSTAIAETAVTAVRQATKRERKLTILK